MIQETTTTAVPARTKSPVGSNQLDIALYEGFIRVVRYRRRHTRSLDMVAFEDVGHKPNPETLGRARTSPTGQHVCDVSDVQRSLVDSQACPVVIASRRFEMNRVGVTKYGGHESHSFRSDRSVVPDGYVISDHDVHLDRLPGSDSVRRKSQVLVTRVAIPAVSDNSIANTTASKTPACLPTLCSTESI